MKRFGETKPTERSIRVTGEAKLSLKPDITIINMNVSNLSEDYSAAVEKLENGINEIKTAISKLHIDVNNLKTSSFNVNSEYEGYSDEKGVWKNRFAGYRASESLKLEIPVNNALLGGVLAAVAGTEAHPEIHISFSVKDRTKAKDRLIAKAVKDSARKAKLLCEAAGVALGEVVEINYSFGDRDFVSPTTYNREMAPMVAAKAALADVAPEDIEVSDSVTVIWAIA